MKAEGQAPADVILKKEKGSAKQRGCRRASQRATVVVVVAGGGGSDLSSHSFAWSLGEVA